MADKYYTKKFNDGWRFAKLGADSSFTDFEKAEKEPVFIPHDMMISDSRNLYTDCSGWYRKSFMWMPDSSEVVSLRFDGVYQEAEVYLNGALVKEWKYGYSAFDAYLSDNLINGENILAVKVTFRAPNSRWYSGAGIYRDVMLRVQPKNRIVLDGVYISPKYENGAWRLRTGTELETGGALTLRHTAYRRNGGEVIWEYEGAVSAARHEAEAVIAAPELWDIDSPELYIMRTSIEENGEETECVYNTFGFRRIEFRPDSGFWLNGRNVKLNGVCEHHDFGCLGSAFYTDAMRRKLRILREMGVNALRLSHNMPATKLMELTDEEGFLVISEAFDMWELSKNEYDYARFFKEWHKADVASWIRRDRNSPSVIMWSIGNEIYDTHISGRGLELTRELKAEAEKHDPYKNAYVTLCSNYMAWENAQKCADAVKLAGYNYGAGMYGEHHRAHPDWVIYGSETASTVQSRGIYHFPLSQPLLSEEDEQCSSLGNSSTSWGARSIDECITSDRDAPYSMGQFLWSGFDYIGEPTPYHTKNSYFGQIDTAGFPKDSYYIYKSQWTDYRTNPMVHIFPYWDFNEGQTIDVRVCANAPEVELFKDGVSLGRQRIDHERGKKLTADYSIKYSAGELRAAAYDENGCVIAEARRSSFTEAAAINVSADRVKAPADGESLVFIELGAEDAKGRAVENANNLIDICVSGAGVLAGLDNGDSTDYSSYKSASKRLFSGKLLAVVQTAAEPGKITVSVSSEGLRSARLEIEVEPAEHDEGTADIRAAAYVGEGEKNRVLAARTIRLSDNAGSKVITKENSSFEVRAVCLPEGSIEQELIWQAVNDAGVKSNIASVSSRGNTAKVTVFGDGVFRIRCMAKNGYDKVKLISQLDYIAQGLGEARINPYEFVSGSLYGASNGQISNGNEKGIATARECTSIVGFKRVDFGRDSAEEVEIPIFALTSEEYSLRIWDGDPENGGELLCDGIYCRPSVWNTYQSEVFRLNRRLTGIHDIYFSTEAKMHIKGFTFIKISRAFEKLAAADCDNVYGDSFRIDDGAVRDIGNNVVFDFNELDFEDGAGSITICGKSHTQENTIHICFRDECGEKRIIADFAAGGRIRQYPLEGISGRKNVSIIFLPGSNFDMEWIQFRRKQ
ncbi:MAG: glycoside hydrolase family 2 TIM barrel-domain containing protein [Candidatus Ornithomonoglobus sp.]